MHVGVLLFAGFDELDAIGPFEVFANATRAGADCEVGCYTLDETDTVRASHGLGVAVDGPLPTIDGEATAGNEPGAAPVDLLLVPGGGWNDRDRPGAWTAAEQGAVPDAIARHHDRGATVAAVCTGGMLAARAGILDDRPAVTHASAMADLEATAAEVVEARVVDDGDVLTSGGVTAGLDLAFHLVEREFGADIAEQVATEMEYERSGRVVSGSGE